MVTSSQFASSVIALAGGTAIGQLVVIIASPLISRIYSPAELGVLAVFVSFLAPAISVAALRYEVAIVIPRSDRVAVHLLWLSLLLVCFLVSLAAVVVLIAGHRLVSIAGVPALGPYLSLLPISMLGGGIYLVFSAWAIRRQRYSLIGRTRLIQQIWLVSLQSALGIASAGPLGLLVGDALGRSAGSLTIVRSLFPGRSLWHSRPRRLASLLAVARRYRRFPMYSTGPALLNSFSLQLPVILLAGYYGSTTVGLFAIGNRVLAGPLNLVGAAVSQVLLGSAARVGAGNPLELERLCRRTVLRLVQIGIVTVVPVAFVAPWAFSLVFGPEWHEAGVYVQLLAPMIFCQFAFGPLGTVLDVLERQDLHVYREIARIVLMTAAVFIGASLGAGDRLTIALLSIAGTFSYSIGLLLAWYAVRSAIRAVHST